MTARWASGGVRVVALVAVLLALPTAAWAAAVPGATYNGTASDGATISLTVSSSGTSVSSYRVLGILGTDTNGAQCQAEAAETPAGGWPGTAITNNAFQFSVFTTFSISGSFPTAQSASGTFDLSDPAVGGGTGCSTGVISWSATTTSTPPGGGGGSAGGGGVTSTNSGQHKLVSVHVTLRGFPSASW